MQETVRFIAYRYCAFGGRGGIAVRPACEQCTDPSVQFRGALIESSSSALDCTVHWQPVGSCVASPTEARERTTLSNDAGRGGWLAMPAAALTADWFVRGGERGGPQSRARSQRCSPSAGVAAKPVSGRGSGARVVRGGASMAGSRANSRRSGISISAMRALGVMKMKEIKEMESSKSIACAVLCSTTTNLFREKKARKKKALLERARGIREYSNGKLSAVNLCFITHHIDINDMAAKMP